MKKLLAVLISSLALSLSVYAEEKDSAGKAEVKEVCHDKMKDGKPVMGKDGKPAQECKKIKTHKKLEGTDIPVKK